METKPYKRTIRYIADKIIKILNDKGFIIQRYDSYSSNSVYLKLDYGVCNSIRISDHEGKKHLCYRYNIIIGCEDNIIEEKYMRYYFNENNIEGLINQILFDRALKLKKYNKKLYQYLMIKNRDVHQNDKGFWRDAKLVTNDLTENLQTKKFVSSVSGREEIIELTQMPDGTYACGPQVVLNAFENAINNQMQLDANAKFKPNEKVKVIASFDELVNYYVTINETINQAKTHALQILGKGYDLEQYDVGTILGATKCDDGMYYTLELPLIPMEFLPERFLSKV